MRGLDMISCFYKGKEIVADDYIHENGYSGVTELKSASRNRLLLCKDPDCNNPLEFANGEIRSRYFRHYKGEDSSSCVYRDYHPTYDIIRAQNILFSHFKKLKKIEIKTDAKLLQRHISNLGLEQDGKVVLAIEIIRNIPLTKRN